MDLSYDTIRQVLEHQMEYYDYADDYGEPGYRLRDGLTPMVVLGDYWCRCGKVKDETGKETLHSYDHHYPRLWARMEAQGVEFEWSDEWVIDYDNSKAYRTQSDSYHWKSAILWREDSGEFLTPDDDIEQWIDEVKNDPHRCLTYWSSGDLIMAGFTEVESNLQSGWHEGMDDDPVKVTDRIRKFEDKDTDIVFLLDESSQFYIGFSAWIRKADSDESED